GADHAHAGEQIGIEIAGADVHDAAVVELSGDGHAIDVDGSSTAAVHKGDGSDVADGVSLTVGEASAIQSLVAWPGVGAVFTNGAAGTWTGDCDRPEQVGSDIAAAQVISTAASG